MMVKYFIFNTKVICLEIKLGYCGLNVCSGNHLVHGLKSSEATENVRRQWERNL